MIRPESRPRGQHRADQGGVNKLILYGGYKEQ